MVVRKVNLLKKSAHISVMPLFDVCCHLNLNIYIVCYKISVIIDELFMCHRQLINIILLLHRKFKLLHKTFQKVTFHFSEVFYPNIFFNPLSASGANMHQVPMLTEHSGIERVKGVTFFSQCLSETC